LLQSPIQIAETDADGRFIIEVPLKGAFVIGAQAKRLGDATNRRVLLASTDITRR